MEDECSGSSAESYHSPGHESSRGRSPSSATSPSSQEDPLSPSNSFSGSSGLLDEATAFLSDLDNYLPLGCLIFEDIVEELAEDRGSGIWRNVTQLPSNLAFDVSFYSRVQRLAAAGWIRISSSRSTANPRFLVFRIYVLPFDIGNKFVQRRSKRLEDALGSLLEAVDVSADTWQGNYVPEKAKKFDTWATTDEGSLFYMFNKLPSPSPSIQLLKEKYAREAMEDLLDPVSALPGLNTRLYPYQRRSAALMLQRESVSTLELDPRLEQRFAPDGSIFYFGARGLLFFRQPRYYDACKGGVLAETMGLGKTVICLALILATKHHPPKVPAPYDTPPKRPTVGSLTDMATSAIHRNSVPWRVEFDRIRHATGEDMQSCCRRLEQTPASYEVPRDVVRWNRNTVQPPPKKMTLSPTTLIVVPHNLCKQWQSEIQKHVDLDFLRILVMDNPKKALPPPDELRSFDVVLFTRRRFEFESNDGSDNQGRRIGATTRICRCSYKGATRIRDCTCVKTDDLYDSPLKHLHFKRLIIDEGHFFSNTNNTAVGVANALITADSRWVVSGTPAKDLLGVEVDMSAAENLRRNPDTKDSRDAVLEQRRDFSRKDDINGAIKSVGQLASIFLRIRPWSALDKFEGRADWDDHVYRHEDFRKKTFSGFSTCLRRTLEAMVVKTQPEDVERDIDLPPLSHEVVRLEPSFYDKLTANLFTVVLTANAVTSERTDVDYLFHKTSSKARYQLISNLRQSAFFWTGFSETDVLASLKSSNGYLAKGGTGCTEEDRRLLIETLAFADTVFASEGWMSMSRSHELGLFVDSWPKESAEHWAFDGSCSPLLTGVSQLLEAQKHVNERADLEDPGDGLAGAGIRASAPARHGSVKEQDDTKSKTEKPIMAKSGIPTSSIDGEPVLKRRASLTTRSGKGSPKKQTLGFKIIKPQKRKSRAKLSPTSINFESADTTDSPSPMPTASESPLSTKQLQAPQGYHASLLSDSPFLQSRIVGTTSAKLSYLISQILKYYQHEKILVFYDGDNVAYYIAQMLELLHVKHEIYAKTLAAHLKSEYVVRFDQETQDRVLLMDVKQAAFGLNLPSASRIYFVNPVCRPNIEAQAIKRAHRIGQTRKVTVETLVLKGTIEEKMLERSMRMTRREHLEASRLEDDGGIREIIQSASVLPVEEGETSGYGQMAPLEEAQQLWGRNGWHEFTAGSKASARSSPSSKKRKAGSAEGAEIINENDKDHRDTKVIRRTLAYVDCTNHDAETLRELDEAAPSEDSDEEPMLNRWRRRSSAANATLFPSPSGITRSEEPFLPSIPVAPSSEGEHLFDEGSSSRIHTGGRSAEAEPQPEYKKLSISHLLNEETAPTAEMSSSRSSLIREILRRL